MTINLKKLKTYIFSILIALGVGGLSAYITMGSMEIFDKIAKPPLTPPSIVFPIVWTILYTLMGVSSAIIYNEKHIKRNRALVVYALQLFFNFMWSILFFNYELYLLSAIWLAVMIALIIYMIKLFYEIKPIAAYLQIPYLIWCLFALYLNIAIFILN